MPGRRVSKLLDRFADAEREFLNQEFLALAVRGGVVRVRIAGIVMKMRVEPADYQGWGVFLPITHDSAMFVRDATLSERQRYLRLTPAASLILTQRKAGLWMAIPKGVDAKIANETMVPVNLVDAAELFDTIVARFDGANDWFDRVDPRADSASAAWLRSCQVPSTEPDKLQRKGLTAQQRLAYVLHYFERVKPERKVLRDRVESQLLTALRHAGATLDGFVEHKDGFRVTYRVAGHRHVSSVNKDDLSVQVAGICLSGQDRKFDLTSLVGVLNESNASYALAIGDDGMSEEDYWAVHPPEQ